jgi:hypothetical protein
MFVVVTRIAPRLPSPIASARACSGSRIPVIVRPAPLAHDP